jgi:histidinol-phosphate aminotransferase
MYSILAQTLGVPVVHIGRSPDTFEIDLQAAQEAIEVGVRSSEFLLRRRCANGVSPAETLRERSFSCRDAARTEFGIPPIRLLFVVHPNSPTANPLTEAEITWLKQLPENILVAIDEAYFEFSQHTLVAEVLQHPNWLVMRTFSKAFRLAAHRVGYGVANPQLTAVLEQVRLPYNLPSFTQAAALIALQHRHELLGILPELLQEREKLCQALNRFGCFQIFPSAGNFLFVKLQAETEDLAQQQLQQLCESLRQQGTIIRHIGGGLRITVGDAQQNQRLIARLGESLKQLNL